jgi:signal transduction protein with GAF and PtsI domain
MQASEKLHFSLFRQVVKAISSTLDLQEVMDMMVRNVIEVMDLKACAIRLLDPKTRRLELLSAHGLSENYIEKGPVRADQSIADAMKGRTVCIRDATKDERTQYRQEAIKEGIASIISVPLTLKGRIIGVLRLYTSEPRDFSPDELEFAEALAEMGAIAIENARMYETIKKDYEDVIGDIHSLVGYRRSI